MPLDRKTKRFTLIFVIGGFLFAALYLIVGHTAGHYLEYALTRGKIAVFPSPDGTQSAYLTSHGALHGWTLKLWISSSDSSADVRLLGTVDSAEGPPKFREILWSEDSTLLVARCHISTVSGTGIRAKNGAVFTHAYDFSSSTHLAPPQEDSADERAWRLHQEKITTLFEQKGGRVTAVTKENLHTRTTKMNHRQWLKWRDRLSRAAAATSPQN